MADISGFPTARQHLLRASLCTIVLINAVILFSQFPSISFSILLFLSPRVRRNYIQVIINPSKKNVSFFFLSFFFFFANGTTGRILGSSAIQRGVTKGIGTRGVT